MGAEHAAAIEKVAAPAEKQQDALAPEEASPEEARLYTLQRQAGNRAVTALLRGETSLAVQRAISFDPTKLMGGRSWTKRVRMAFAGADTFGKIGNAFADYSSASTDPDKLFYADVLIGLTDHWLSKYQTDVKQNNRKLDVTNLGRQARAEARELRRKRATPGDRAYLDKLQAGSFGGAHTARTKMNVLDPAEDVAGGKTSPDVAGADERAVKLASRYGLTAAEIAAIRLFTQPDYAYINPAAAGSGEWLASNVLGAKDPALASFGPRIAHTKGWGPEPGGAALGWARGLKPLMSQGEAHAAQFKQALDKLDPYAGGVAFRGERLTEAKFKAKYQRGAKIPFAAFASAAKVRTVAEGYAAGRLGDIRPSVDQDVSYVAEVHVKSARDISLLSAAKTKVSEEEIVILPGTTFTVVDVIPVQSQDPGTPPARLFYTVVLKED